LYVAVLLLATEPALVNVLPAYQDAVDAAHAKEWACAASAVSTVSSALSSGHMTTRASGSSRTRSAAGNISPNFTLYDQLKTPQRFRAWQDEARPLLPGRVGI
jgi:hypothetical protein